MNVGIGGLNVSLSVSVQASAARSGQSDRPVFDRNRVWSSLAEFNAAGVKYGEEWVKVYSDRFSGLENGGKISMEELDGLLRSEFASFGAWFVDSNPKDVRTGQNDIFIDDANRRKMANDPEYRARVFGLIQRELSLGSQGFRYQWNGETIQTSRLTGSVISISDENASHGGVPYLGMCTSGPTFSASSQGTASTKATPKKGKSILDMLKELAEELQKRMAEKRDAEKRETAKETRAIRVDIKA